MTQGTVPPQQRGQILFHAKFKPVETREGSRTLRVMPSVIKNLLNVIDRHCSNPSGTGCCFASYKHLAMETGLSASTVERAIKVMVLMDLLVITPERKGQTTIYGRRICWTNLASFAPVQKRLQWNEERPEVVATAPRCEVPIETCEVPIETREVPIETREVPIETVSGPHAERLGSPPVGTERIELIELHEHSSRTYAKREQRTGGTGVLEKRPGQRQRTTDPPELCLIPNLQPDALAEPEMIEALYQVACERGLYKASEQHRLWWFAWCHRLQVWRQSQIRRSRDPPNVIGFLHKVLKNGQANAVHEARKRHNHADEEWARKAMREFDLID